MIKEIKISFIVLGMILFILGFICVAVFKLNDVNKEKDSQENILIKENGQTDTEVEAQWKTENVKITVEEDSITKTCATINIEDKNEKPKSWGLDFEIQISAGNDKWEELIKKKTINWIQIMQQPSENGITEMDIDWSKMYGELKKGVYRVVKYNGSLEIYSEPFEIKEDNIKQAMEEETSDLSDFVLLSDVIPDAILEIRYYTTYNFVGERIDGYEEPCALLTKKAAIALKEVSDELITKGYRLKIYDAYRPKQAVKHFMNWVKDADDTRMKQYFYPNLDKSAILNKGYITERSGHSRGSTVDLTLFDMNTEKEVDMGGTFDYFGEVSHIDYRYLTDEQYENRMLLRNTMIAHGFKAIKQEWWHFTLKDEPFPDTYFTFPVSSKSV